MGYVLGAICGLIWGTAAALLNFQISKNSIMKDNTASLLGANVLRILVDLAALLVVFLLRKVLPFRYEAALIATAVALSMVTIVCAYRMSADLMKQKKDGAQPPSDRSETTK